MKLLFLTVWDFSNENNDGICKKLKSQVHAFEENGFEVTFTYIKNGSAYIKNGEIETKLGFNGVLGKIQAHHYFLMRIDYSKYDCAYIRYGMMDPWLFQIVKKCHKAGVKTVVEIPTFPYDTECKSKFLDRINLAIDKCYRNRMYHYVDRVAVMSEEAKILNIPVVQIQNGVRFDQITLRMISDNQDDTISMIAVSSMAPWHGYDRLLSGMAAYYEKHKENHKEELNGEPCRRLILHIVGDGKELPKYKQMVKDFHLEEFVYFHGFQSGKELDAIYDQCDLGIECLANFRKKLFLSSSLKSKEYSAKGLPIVAAGRIDSFPTENTPYLLDIPNDESILDMEQVIAFYDKMYKGKEKKEVAAGIREDAYYRCDWNYAIKPVIDYYNEKSQLVLITDGYPFGAGENTFISPELPYLMEQYQVTILSKNGKDEQTTKLPNGVKVVRLNYGNSKLIAHMLAAFGHSEFYQEIGLILREHVYIGKRIKMAWISMGQALMVEKLLQSILVENRKTLLYSYWYNYGALAATLYKKKHPGTIAITRVHGYDLFDEQSALKYQPYRMITDKRLDRVFFISEIGKKYYLKRWNFSDDSRYQVAYLGSQRLFDVDSTIDVRGQKNKIYHIVSCASMLKIKRIELVIEALSRVEGYQIAWTHYGTGECCQELIKLAEQKLSGKENISYEFAGQVSNSEIQQAYQNGKYDCFIMTSSTEGLPVSIMEALSYGIPVISTNVGGISEIVDEQVGILLDENPSRDEIAQALNKVLLCNDGQREQYHSNAVKRWESTFNAQKNAPKFIESIQAIGENSCVE